jgi:hypothetical protein
MVKDEGDDLLADSHFYFWICGSITSAIYCQVHGVNVMQAEMQTAEPLKPKPSCSEAENDTEKLKSTGTDQIPAELIHYYYYTYL